MMLVELASRFVNWLIRPPKGRPGPHDLFDAKVRRTAVISRHAATDVALGDNVDQVEAFYILNHRRAAAAGCPHCLCGLRCCVLVRAARRRLDRFHDITAAAHGLYLSTIEVSVLDPRRGGGRMTRRQGDGYEQEEWAEYGSASSNERYATLRHGAVPK